MEDNLFLVTKNGKTGFINDKGNVIIDFAFNSAFQFSEGLASVKINNKFGYINTKGNLIIQPSFERAYNFSEGLAIVNINNKYGFINKDGQIVIAPQYYSANNFQNGLARVNDDVTSKGKFIDKSGVTILDGKNFLLSEYREGLINCPYGNGWGFIDTNGNSVISSTYQLAHPFYENKAAVSPKKIAGKPNRKTLYGFINNQNEMVIPPLFEGADMKFSEGLCAIWDRENNGYGFINDKGQSAIPCDFYYCGHFSEGFAVFKHKGRNKKYGFIDKNGNIAIEPIYTNAEEFHNGLSAVIIGKEYENFLYGWIDKSGNYIWEPSR